MSGIVLGFFVKSGAAGVVNDSTFSGAAIADFGFAG